MPAIPSNMKACRARTQRDLANRNERRQAEAEQQARTAAQLEQLTADLVDQHGEGVTIFICKRGNLK